MPLSEEQLREIVAKVKIPKLERTKPAPVLAMIDRKLTVEGQRERVARDIKDLATAERQNAGQVAQWENELYYRQQHEALAEAERWANAREGSNG
jgi:hypothetical protein